MQCVKCKAEWESENLTNCPYCQALLSQNFDEDILIYEPHIKSEQANLEDRELADLEELQDCILHITERYGCEVYNEEKRLRALIGDLFVKDKFSMALKEVVEIGIAGRVYALNNCVDEHFEAHYFDVISSICSTTEIEKELAIDVVNLLFWGVNLDCYPIGEDYVEPEDIANDVLNSVLNKKTEEKDFADSIMDFINNSNQ